MSAPAWMNSLPTAPILGWRPTPSGSTYLTYPGEKGLLTVAPNRSGKGVSSIGINAIAHRASLVLVDPKHENTDLFARWRAIGLGQPTFVFDPLHVVPDDRLPPPPVAGGPRRAGFNPIQMIRESRHPVADAKMMSNSLIPMEGNNPFFPLSAQSFFAAAGCLTALNPLYPHPRTMRSLWHDLTNQTEAAFTSYLQEMALSKVADGFVAREAIEWLGGSQEVIRNIRKTMKTAAGRILDDPHILDCLSYSSLDFGELQRTPMSVFMVLPGWACEIYSGFMRLLMSCMFAQIERAGLPPPGVLRPKTLIIMDEFATLRRSETIREVVPRLPGYSVQFWPVVQDLNQLRQLYESGWETFISNPGAIQFFGGSPDNFTSEYLSRMTGVQTVQTTTVSQQLRVDGGGMSFGSTGRPILFPHEITNLNAKPEDKYKQVVIFPGSGLAYAQRLLYYRDFPDYMEFMERHGREDMTEAYRRTFWRQSKPAKASPKAPASVKSNNSAASDGHWRDVVSGEVYAPGAHFRLDLNGKSQIWVARQT